ncbi:MAG: leucine-rich repeat protein [Eubacterium sp.]
MEKFKKIPALVLALIIAAASVVPAFAETYFSDGVFSVTRNSDLTAVIAEYEGKDENMVIPSTMFGHDVVGIANTAFYGNTLIKTAVIPDTVVSIGQSAFYLAENLTSVNIPVNCTSVGNYAFQYCSSLENVSIDSNLTEISKQLFYGCSSLTEVTLPSTVETINSFAFGGCTSLERIFIPQATTTFNPNIFKDSPNVTIYGYSDSAANTYAEENGIAFVAIDDVDKSSLDGILAEAGNILTDAQRFTEESVKLLETAYENAQAVSESKFSLQDDVISAYAAVDNAIAALESILKGCIYGDADLNGEINIDDATIIQRYVANLTDFTFQQLAAADANNDGVIDVNDATDVQKYIAAFDVENVGNVIE